MAATSPSIGLTTGLPAGHTTVNSFVAVAGAAEFIDFLVAVLDGSEVTEVRTPDRDGSLIHAEIRIGDAVIMLADRKPDWPFTPALTQVYVADAAEVLARAVRRGAKVVTEVSPFYGGFAIARFLDPWHNLWWLFAFARGAADDATDATGRHAHAIPDHQRRCDMSTMSEATRARPYHQLMRPRQVRLWRSIVAAFVTPPLWVLFTAAVCLSALGIGGWTGGDVNSDDSALGFLEGNLELAVMIPAAMMATRIGFGRRGGWVSSVTGRLRWLWLLRCYAYCALVFAVISVVVDVATALASADGTDSLLNPGSNWIGLTAVVLLTTPLQAAGEEYVFRGWITQLVGAWIPRIAFGAVVSGLCRRLCSPSCTGSRTLG